MNRLGLLLSASCLLPAVAGAQTPAADIQRGIQAYQNTNIEAARVAFTSIINSKQQVTNDQKVLAYQYLGGVWALSGKPDSAFSYFLAAVSNDPFLTSLDTAGHFAADEQAAFARAKRSVFGIGIRPVAPFALNPNAPDTTARRYLFQVVSTHSAKLDIELVHLAADSARETIASIPSNEGLHDVPWNGLVNAQLADTGLYELRVTANDRINTNTLPAVEKHKFRINHVRTPLEDTIPAFTDVKAGGTDTLGTLRSTLGPIRDGVNAGFLTVAAGAMGWFIVGQRDSMPTWGQHYGVGLSLGLVSGIVAVSYGLTHRKDQDAVKENARRIQARAQFNAAVRARNASRRLQTILILLPITGSVGG